MNKIISFSLWGTNPKYTTGAIRNADLAIRYYPDWKCRFYLGRSVENKIKDALSAFENTELIDMSNDDWDDCRSTLWRFYPASDESVDVMISRDCDSRLGSREKAAVDEWMSSDRLVHTMRDHPAHGIPMLAGMNGFKKNAIPDMKKLIHEYVQNKNAWGIDQGFLTQVIYPKVKDCWLEHDSFFGVSDRNKYKKAFPTPRDRKTMFFVGQPFNAEDKAEIILKDNGYD